MRVSKIYKGFQRLEFKISYSAAIKLFYYGKKGKYKCCWESKFYTNDIGKKGIKKIVRGRLLFYERFYTNDIAYLPQNAYNSNILQFSTEFLSK